MFLCHFSFHHASFCNEPPPPPPKKKDYNTIIFFLSQMSPRFRRKYFSGCEFIIILMKLHLLKKKG